MQYHDTQPSELFEYLKPYLKDFLFHNFISRWQDVQFKDSLINVIKDTIIFCVDFSNNYTLMAHNETQNMHWHNFQINILVHIDAPPSSLIDSTVSLNVKTTKG
jgi:hypothetical protein